MTLAQLKSPPPRLARAVEQRTRGRTHGPVTRLMSPSDLGEILKPFVFLDLFDHEGAPFNGPLHPHSGIATLTYVAEGAVSYIDPDNVKGTLSAGGVEWMQAGRGMWHGGGLDKAGRTRGFQLWIALPPELELGPTLSIYQAPEAVPQDGPVRVLLGSYGSASNAIVSPSPINYLAVRLKAGERWRYEPPTGHTVLWAAIASGVLSAPDELRHGDLAAFEPSSESVEFEALTDTEFVLGSALQQQRKIDLL
jgi:redox-sensitive bicupin YhaK (pirin superfamily)